MRGELILQAAGDFHVTPRAREDGGDYLQRAAGRRRREQEAGVGQVGRGHRERAAPVFGAQAGHLVKQAPVARDLQADDAVELPAEELELVLVSGLRGTHRHAAGEGGKEQQVLLDEEPERLKRQGPAGEVAQERMAMQAGPDAVALLTKTSGKRERGGRLRLRPQAALSRGMLKNCDRRTKRAMSIMITPAATMPTTDQTSGAGALARDL
jgi:hypothetical protein